MLHAVIHNKKAQERGNAWTLEDNVTSTFFGPLCFLSAKDVTAVLKVCFPSIKDLDDYPFIEFSFWPSLKKGKDSTRKGGIEPDLLIHFKKSEHSEVTDFLLLVEVKWQGYEDTNDKHQVHEQIDAITTHLQPEKLQAVYLTQHDDKQKPKDTYEGISIDSVKWVDIAHRLESELDVSKGGKHWQVAVLAYLEKMLSSVFYGFKAENFRFTPDFNEKTIYFRGNDHE